MKRRHININGFFYKMAYHKEDTAFAAIIFWISVSKALDYLRTDFKNVFILHSKIFIKLFVQNYCISQLFNRATNSSHYMDFRNRLATFTVLNFI